MSAATRPLQIRPDFRAGIRLLARLARVAEQACQTTGISLPQYRLLVSISGQPQRASELATAVGVSRPTLTALVDGLEQGGYLRRVPVANDRRGIQLVPTDAGRGAVERAEDALARRLSEIVDRDMVKLVADAIAIFGDAFVRRTEGIEEEAID
jgi:DNA-binding MarR family transcriptional regulator